MHTIIANRTQDAEAVQKFLKKLNIDYQLTVRHTSEPRNLFTFTAPFPSETLEYFLRLHLKTYKHNLEGEIKDVSINGQAMK